MTPRVPPFREAVKRALRDAASRQHLHERLGRLNERQAHVWDLEAVSSLVQHATRMRQHALAHLGELWTLAEAQATARGIGITWAETAEEARNHVLAWTKQAQGKIALVRSVVVEEIALPSSLEATGQAFVVADMGGYVAHLVGELPAHPIITLAHLGERDVAELWHLFTGHSLPLTRSAIVQAVHAHLRVELSECVAVVVGAHGIVAETGAPFVFDWEGHAVAALQPGTQTLVVVGLDQIVPTVDHVELLGHVWARAALGVEQMPQTLYLQPASNNPQGTHIVVVDNGRAELLNQGWADLLQCVHCGACATACPVVQEIGNHTYGLPYAGPVATVWGPARFPATHAELAWASTLCGACGTVCPVGVNVPSLIARVRSHRDAQNARRGWRPWHPIHWLTGNLTGRRGTP